MERKIKLQKFTFTTLMFALFMLLSIRVSAAADNIKTNVYVYMIGSDLETKNAAATADLNEMLDASKYFNGNTNLFVYAGGAKKWHNDIFSSEENRCVKIDKNGTELLYSDNTGNMTNPETLYSFLCYCSAYYPADRQILIFWDHGSGYIGFGLDEQDEYSTPMNPLQIMNALADSGAKFDIVGFDACMMASFEMAYSISDYAKYMVASEEMIPISGWDYRAWLTYLAKDPNIDSVELCKNMVDTYMDWCKNNAPGIKDALSVIDLNVLYKYSSRALSDFSNDMLNDLISGKSNIVKIQKSMYSSLGKANKFDMIDAIDFLMHIDGYKAKRLREVLQESIVYNMKYPNDLNLNGIMIYIPASKDTIIGMSLEDLDGLKGLGIDDCYSDWLNCFRKYLKYGKEGHEKKRTLMDIFTGYEQKDYEEAIYNAVSQIKLDVSGCCIMEDENYTPHLVMPEDQKELLMCIYQALYAYRGDEIIDYGGYIFNAEDFPIQYKGFWKSMCDDWLFINDIMVPFCMEDKEKLSEERVAVYGYTKMCLNGEEGALFVRVVYDDKENSVEVEPLCYQNVNISKSDEIPHFGRVIPVANLKPDDEVYFCCATYSEQEGNKFMSRITDDMKWGDITSFEWKYKEEIDEFLTAYAAIDLFYNTYQLELKSYE